MALHLRAGCWLLAVGFRTLRLIDAMTAMGRSLALIEVVLSVRFGSVARAGCQAGFEVDQPF